MAYLTTASVNAWLAATKYTVSTIDSEMEAADVAVAFAALSTRYDTTTWVDTATTPDLVVTAMSMIYAAWFLQRQISDDEMDSGSYPIRLEERGLALLAGIANDTIDLPGVDPDPELTAAKAPLFFPTDSSTSLWEDDPTDPDGSPRAFTMGAVF